MSRTFANRSSMSDDQYAAGRRLRGGVQQQGDNRPARRATVEDRTQRCN